MGFTAHIDNAIDRIRVRQNILKMMGGSTWGSESNILRVPRKALLGSVVSHGFVAVGSGAYYKDLRKLDTCALNPAARAIAVSEIDCAARRGWRDLRKQPLLKNPPEGDGCGGGAGWRMRGVGWDG